MAADCSGLLWLYTRRTFARCGRGAQFLRALAAQAPFDLAWSPSGILAPGLPAVEEEGGTMDSQRGSMRILAIDDDPLTLELLKVILSDLAQVDVALGGKEGISAALDNPPDLVLCDVTMPEVDGIEVCRRLRHDPKTSQVPIVCVSAGAGEAEEIQALSAGAIDYIKKPLSVPLTRARVKVHLDSAFKSAQVWELARRDGLTGIFNRRYFDERLASEWGRHRRLGQWLSVALVDLDHFKMFNDLYGHVKGDECLIAAADRLRRCARRADEVAARFGGEEFVFLLPSTPPERADEFAAMVRSEIVGMRLIHGGTGAGWVTCSVGIASVVPDGSLDPIELVREADEALYAAKRAGRDRHEARVVMAEALPGSRKDSRSGLKQSAR